MKKLRVGVVVILLFLAFFAAPTTADAYEDYEENGFVYQVQDKKAVVSGTKLKNEELKDGELVIPDKLGGFPVTGIAAFAFENAKFVSVTFPETIEEIGYGAFQQAKKLKAVHLPEKITTVSSRAFMGCTALSEVVLGNRVTGIEGWAFYNCISLKRITLPNSVKSIGDSAFAKCYKLGSVKLNERLSAIGVEAFYMDYALKKISIPSSVKSISDRAFAKCSDLVGVEFGNESTKLGSGVFSQCVSMRKAVLPKKIKDIPESSFAGCVKLIKVVVPENVAIIKRRAFLGCTALEGITLNEKLYAVGDQAFANSGLKKIKLKKNMQFVGNGAFRGTKLSKLNLPSKVTFIGNRVFADCRRLKKIVIPNSVKGINPGAFNNCVSLREISVSKGNRDYCSEGGVLYDKNKTKLIQYPLHKTDKTFSTPRGLSRIRSNAFAGNPYLQKVTITADSIGKYAFMRMEKLNSVILSYGVKKIGDYAFQDSVSLQKAELPDSITSIGHMAFARTAVKTIHISSNLAELGNNVFYGCNKLAAFTGGRGAKYAVMDGVLYNGKMTELLKYPAKRAAKTFVVPASVKVAKENAFDCVAKLVKLEFGENFARMEYHAVYNGKKLKSIVFKSKKLIRVSYSAVSQCNKLAVIVGPSNNYGLKNLAIRANAAYITL